MSTGRRILLVDDESGILDTLRILLRGNGYDVVAALSGREAIEMLPETSPDIVLTDIRMPGLTGLEVMAKAHELDPETAVILMTAQASLQTAVQAVNEGAYYYLQKPFANEELLAICRRAAEARELRVENKALKKEIRRQSTLPSERPTGKNRHFVDVLKLAETVAPTESTVLITGESGSGKEVLARYIHRLSGRVEGDFFSLNCGALPEGLLESELFGHVKGAFTGAIKDKVGLFEAANGGTLFLDEIGETTPATQVRLLRALQEREVIPVGSTEVRKVDVRILAATNSDLNEKIRRGSFRSDVYYRLNVIALHLPPLRDRKDDIPMLARLFLDSMAKQEEEKVLAPDALQVLCAYDWPGNVRELENEIQRALAIGDSPVLAPHHFSDRLTTILKPVEATFHPGESLRDTMGRIEGWILRQALATNGGQRTSTARVLGITREGLYKKMKRLGIE